MRSGFAFLLLALLVLPLARTTPAWSEDGDGSRGAEPKADQPKAPRPKAPKAAEPLPETPRPGSLRALGRRLTKLAERISAAKEEAERDPDEILVDLYLAYGVNELKNRKRAVRAEHLLRIMVDPSNAPALRTRAQEALADGTLRGDIEISATSTRRGMSERAGFCRSDVVEHLKDDDAEARRKTHELLMKWYRSVGRGNAAILAYKPDDKKTWGRAISAWQKELRKQ